MATRGKSSVHGMAEQSYVHGKIARLEAELKDQQAIRRMILRQLARGDKPTRSHDATHKAATVRIGEIERDLERFKRRVRQ